MKEVRKISGIIEKLFGKKDKKPVAVAFVDYEHWYISMVKLYDEKPDIQGWVKAMNKKYDLREIIVFADFSNNTLAREINRIREVTSRIVQTANTSQNHKKDFTDFIMLDQIYQRAMAADNIDTFIVFSGDGHFSSAVSFLKNVCKKDVGVCGVRDAFSNQLKNCASWSVELPDDKLLYSEYYKMILDNVKRVEGNGWKRNAITFERTVDAVSSYYKAPAEKISRALISLMDHEYVTEREEYTGDGKRMLCLEFMWSKILRDGIWQPSADSRRTPVKKTGAEKRVAGKALQNAKSGNGKTPSSARAKKKITEPKKPERINNAPQKKEPAEKVSAEKPKTAEKQATVRKTVKSAVKKEAVNPVKKEPEKVAKKEPTENRSKIQVVYPVKPVFETEPLTPAETKVTSAEIAKIPATAPEVKPETKPAAVSSETVQTPAKKKKKKRYYYPRNPAKKQQNS